MPPRITRNSHRPRASDRTMVDFESPFAFRFSENSTVPLTHQRTLIRMGATQTSLAKPNSSGLDLEKTSRLQSRQNFFLDIPFDRTYRHEKRRRKSASLRHRPDFASLMM